MALLPSYPKIKCGNGLIKAKKGPKVVLITKLSKEKAKNSVLEIQLYSSPPIVPINLTLVGWNTCGKLLQEPKMSLLDGIIIWQKWIVRKKQIEKI